MVQQEIIDKLSAHVATLVEQKKQLAVIQKECQRIKGLVKSEEEDIKSIMETLCIGECNAGSLSLKLLNSKRKPTVPLKVVLPLVQKVLGATPSQIEYLVSEINTYKNSNVKECTRLVCRECKKPKQATAKPPVVPRSEKPSSLSQAMDILNG